ncbi:unnamed protein product [Ceutorhynchus assimilis]|uniref:Complex I assembly factor TIMMDC1, mitochondrial n=1 Tax=Ceutorhynchus assimilis TaxID=467358 RepID=A0A9N9MRN2_9CUCU|nr:unnamed protein product [Ceutorhynchus assimilis]
MAKVFNSLRLGFLPFISQYFSLDSLNKQTETERLAAPQIAEQARNQETGWDRVKKMFQVDELGNLTPEFNSITQSACMSMFVGGLFGGTAAGKTAYEKFMKNNEATTFKSHLDAKRELQDAVTRAFSKGALKWATKLTVFSVSFIGLTTLIQVYRGKYGVMEYVGAGAATGFLVKFNGGPRTWVVSSAVGSTLGLICGGTTLGILKLSGLSMEEARYWQQKWKNHRSEHFRKGIADYLEKEDFAVIKIHNDEVGEAGRSLDNLVEEKVELSK